MAQMQDRVSLVTGGASGIGKATALAFAREGAAVVIADVQEKGGIQLADEINGAGGRAIFVLTDVSSAEQVKSLINKTIETFGRLDYACNNAGIEGESATTAEYTEASWDRVLDVNLKGIWLCMKYEIPQMLKQGKGAIVNMASIAGLVGFARVPAYAASKGGVIQLTRTAAIEYSSSGIRVNAICPGVIETPMIDRLLSIRPELKEGFKAMHPIGRIGRPEEVAEAVIWLCSDAASFVTGHPLAVDGGFVAQ